MNAAPGDHLHEQDRTRGGAQPHAVEAQQRGGREYRCRTGSQPEREARSARAYPVFAQRRGKSHSPGNEERDTAAEKQSLGRAFLREDRPENPRGCRAVSGAENDFGPARRLEGEIGEQPQRRRDETEQQQLARRGKREQREAAGEIRGGAETGDRRQAAEAQPEKQRRDRKRDRKRRQARLDHRIVQPGVHC